MIKKYIYKEKEFNFILEKLVKNSSNRYTVLVGKNGTGKSRLLNAIILKLIRDDSVIKRYMRRYSGVDLYEIENSKLEFEYMPSNIIAISISPFDKFPLLPMMSNRRRQEVENYYYYLGLRQLRSIDLGKEYMSNIFLSLLSSVYEDSYKINKIMNVLTYLGYQEGIQIKYRRLNLEVIDDILDSSEPIQYFIEKILTKMQPVSMRINRTFFDTDREHKISYLLEIINKYRSLLLYNQIGLFLSKNGVQVEYNEISFDLDFLFLLETGVLVVEDIIIKKRNVPEPFTISEASSGEQSVVVSMLGITSRIQDNSLICIDEPEICLHPEWQEKYIDFLMHTFKDFKKCHFIIATHSPLIVSKLEDENCFVTTMEDGSVKCASELNKRSVDFQLANTFKTPGYKNEYLTRELISFITMFGEDKKVEEKVLNNIKFIVSLKKFISEEDPVKEMISMVEVIIKEYSL